MASLIDKVSVVIMLHLQRNPDKELSTRQKLVADDPCWGDLDSSKVNAKIWDMACDKLRRDGKVQMAPLLSSLRRKSRSRIISTAVKLNPDYGKPPAKPEPKFVLPPVERTVPAKAPSRTKLPAPPVEKPRPSPPKPAPPPPLLIDIDADIFGYACKALSVLRKYGRGVPWQTIGKRDCGWLIRESMPGLSKKSAARLAETLEKLGFIRIEKEISYVLAKDELTREMLRGIGLRLKETPAEFRAELQANQQRIKQLEEALSQAEKATTNLQAELTAVRELFDEATAQLERQQREIDQLNTLLESRPRPVEVEVLDPALRTQALRIINEWA